MSDLLSLHLDQVPDPIILEPGEYQVRIVDATIKDSKATKGRQYIAVALEVIDEPDAETIFENLNFPMADDKPNTVKLLKRTLKNFCLAFGFDLTNPGNPAEWKGAEGLAILKKVRNEKFGVDQNQVSVWIAAA